MLHVQMIPEVIGLALDGETGNPVIIGQDRSNGITMTIQVESAYWDTFIQNAKRLKGVGIAMPGGAVPLDKLAGNGAGS